MAKAPTKGEVFECRVARLLHHEGAFVRRAVDLQMHFGEPFTVTDVDILALTFSASLQRKVTVGECKATEARGAASAADRLLWGTGVRGLVPGAERHFLATTRPASDRVRRLARTLQAGVMDERDIERRESLLGLSGDDLSGPHDPALIAAEKAAFQVARRDDDLKRVWGFVRADFWFSDPVYGLKRAFGALRLLADRWHPDLPMAEAKTVRWLAQEGLGAVMISLVELAGDCYRQPADVFERRLSERLAEGIASYAVMQDLSKEVDRYVMAILKESGVDPARQLDRLGALNPRPPGYAESLLEVLERLARAPRATAELGRLADERIAADRGSSLYPSTPPSEEQTVGGQLLETVATFLRGQIRIPDGLLRPLFTDRPTHTPESSSGGGSTSVTSGNVTPVENSKQATPGRMKSSRTESDAASGASPTATVQSPGGGSGSLFESQGSDEVST